MGKFENWDSALISKKPTVGLLTADIAGLQIGLPAIVFSQLPAVIEKFSINNKLRLAHFLAQCSHESNIFRVCVENLKYSVEGLNKVFSKYFPGNLAEVYVSDPEAIASRVYANRMGNGNEASQDGYRFRGRGYIQLTGKSNYELFSKFIKEDCRSVPDLVATKYPLMSAAYFFDVNAIWPICDKGIEDNIVGEVTKKVNGGAIGLEDRIKKFKEFYRRLT